MKKPFQFKLILIALFSIFLVSESTAQEGNEKNVTAFLVKYDNSINNFSFSDLEKRVLTRNILFYVSQVNNTNEVIVLSNSKNQISYQDLKSVFVTDIKILETKYLNDSQFNFSNIPYYKESKSYNSFLTEMNAWKNQNISLSQNLTSLFK